MTNVTLHHDLHNKIRSFRGSPLGPALRALAVAAPSLVLAACVATGTPAGTPGVAESSTGAGVTLSADASASPGASGSTGVMPAPSSPSPSTIENATAGPNPTPGGGASSGKAANPVIVCIGPDQGPPCVPSDQVAIVAAAEVALSSEARGLIETATVRLTASCPAGAPAAACGTSDAPVATVRFDRQGGGSLGTVYVYRSATGGLEGALLP
jgi:hypothetical protein